MTTPDAALPRAPPGRPGGANRCRRGTTRCDRCLVEPRDCDDAQTFVPALTVSVFDDLAGMPPLAETDRRSAQRVVTLSLGRLGCGEPLVSNAGSNATRRFFNGFFPIRIVLREVAKRFLPPRA